MTTKHTPYEAANRAVDDLTTAALKVKAERDDAVAVVRDCLLALGCKNLKAQQFWALAAQAERRARALLARLDATP